MTPTDRFSDRLYRRPAASQYLLERWGISRTAATLAKLAHTGGGPRFKKDRRTPLYPESELDAWAQAMLGPVQNSTSDVGKLEVEPAAARDGLRGEHIFLPTIAEVDVFDLSADLWNAIVDLGDHHPADLAETARDIHNIQNRVLARATRRNLARKRPADAETP